MGFGAWLLLLVVPAACLPAQTLENLALAYRKNPKPQTRAAVLRYAGAHPKDINGALALLVLGATEMEQRQFGDAQQHLQAAEKRLPALRDYAAYLRAAAEFELREFSETEHALKPVWDNTPISPLAGKTVVLQANSFLQDNKPKKAIELVQKHLTDLPESQAEDLLAHAYELAGDAANAALHYQRIYVEFPLSKEASDADAAMQKYAKPASSQLMARGLKLIEGGDYSRARKELEAILPSLSGGEHDFARVRIGAAQYLGRDYREAHNYLGSFELSASEPEAERLYYLLQSARRLDKIDEMNATLDRLSRSYPQSRWRLQALIAVGSYYGLRNEPAQYEPVYRACYESFPSDPQAAGCYWRVTWAEYLRDPASAASGFENYLKKYPDSENATGALYFLGRIAEGRGDRAAARGYFEELNSAYPNYYYAVLARARLTDAGIAKADPSPEVKQFLTGIHFSARRRSDSFAATPATKVRIDRARLLESAGLDDLAESELRFGAKTDAQPQVIAVELAELANRRDQPDIGIRAIKRLAPSYLFLPIEPGNEKFWRLAFPLPYRKSLEQYSQEHDLDPYLVAALIRQESEFNAKAVSRANAYGLTQVLPSTGRELSRKLKIPRFRATMLFQPDTNLQIGTFYLRSLLDQLNGKWEATLASYNAGKRHVNSWMTWSEFREPAEFVETIPFSETRNYVQSVLRNADVYRRLYSRDSAK
jgi:soluble lytic murein transglycosylase